MTDRHGQAIEAAAKALWDGEKHRRPWLSESVTEVERRLRRIRAREIVAAYKQALEGEREPEPPVDEREVRALRVLLRWGRLAAPSTRGGEAS